MLKKPSKSEEYRRLAAEAATLAVASNLNNVREKHQAAALRWTALADTEEGRRTPAQSSEHPFADPAGSPVDSLDVLGGSPIQLIAPMRFDGLAIDAAAGSSGLVRTTPGPADGSEVGD